ncbi:MULTISPECIES: cytochrome P450 [Burkholderiaceae]|uniref:Cytochrome P450 n=2 Tax=Burkholderiaceae TaxID=119060 RepID=A0A643G4Q9_9BURK|nr:MULTISPECIES: cytochrome P450 [Burkholderiaceae]NOV23676.1 cytochrome P450 [Cupriavidus necator]OXI30987.1 cytochrome P450 [Burkholderia aenigmatica]QOT81737.1 cytochrome P450 [Cupriavidus basilensis]BDB30420.1 cytochrome P450 [Cupriavidus sp. P-10]
MTESPAPTPSSNPSSAVEGRCPFDAAANEPKSACPFHAEGDSGGIPDFPPKRVDPLAPPPVFFQMQQKGELAQGKLWDGKIAWLVTRYDDVRAVLSDSRFSSDVSHPGFPSSSAAVKVVRSSNRTFITLDEPKHSEQRRMLTGEFTIRKIENLRPRLQAIVDKLLEDFAMGPQPSDLVSAFTLATPALAISELLGVPYDDHDFFQEQAMIMTSSTATREEASAANQALCEYLRELVAKRSESPGEDILSRLIVNHVRKGDITETDVVSLGRLLLIAGHETTANTTSMGVLFLLQRPDIWEELRQNPSLVPNAVEEMLRFLDVIQSGTRRVALEDVVVNGQLIRAGDPVVVLSISANRDQEQFKDPHVFDLRRDARTQIAFGYGPHQCMGQVLARVEMQIMFTALLKRLPNLRLAVPIESLAFKSDSLMYGVRALPVSW